MSQLFMVKYRALKNEMDALFDDDQEITSQDIFDTFVKTIGRESDLLDEEELKGLVFNQFRQYGDYDKTMNEVAKNISDIQKSTEDAICAIDNNDKSLLKNAYSQLKEYQKRILELENDVYTDEITGVYNRKYLNNHELDQDGRFKMDGMLVHLSIVNFSDINREHGCSSGDTVLKYISKLLQGRLKSVGVYLIRYMGAQFIVLSKEAVATKVDSIFKETVDEVIGKKFKTREGGLLRIELQLDKQSFNKDEDFKAVYKNLIV